MTRCLGLAGLAVSALLLAPGAARAWEAGGDLFLSYTNDDGQLDRWGSEVLWVEPVAEWLRTELGATFRQLDSARWGHAHLGATFALPTGLDHLTLGYEHGAGDGADGRYQHLIGRASWRRALLPGRLFADAGLQWIRVDDVEENLARVGGVVLPLEWWSFEGGYHWSVFGGDGSEAWNGRTDVALGRTMLFGGYARSEDTVDLRSIGLGRVTGDPSHEVFLGATLPVGANGVTLTGTRYESEHDTRYTLTFTWRLGLPFRRAPDVAAPPRLRAPLPRCARPSTACVQLPGALR